MESQSNEHKGKSASSLGESENGRGVSNKIFLLAFASTHAAMAAEKALATLSPSVIPTPTSITASCGMSLRLKNQEQSVIHTLLKDAGIPLDSYDLYEPDEQLGSYKRCEA